MKQKIIDNILIPVASWMFDHIVFSVFAIFFTLITGLLSYGFYGLAGWTSVKFLWIIIGVVMGFWGLGYLNQILYTEEERATTADWILLSMLFK